MSNNDLMLHRAGLLSRGDAKAVGRGLARIDANSQLELAKIEAEANLHAARVQSTVYVTRQAMQGTALISELEAQLGQMVPESRGRVQGIADIGCYTIAELVADTGRRVSR
jgi:hypothetical protein